MISSPCSPGSPGHTIQVLGAILLLAATASCQKTARSLPPGPAKVSVAMSENRFAYQPPRSTGRVVFEARNEGHVDHELVLVIVPEDLPPLDEQLRSGTRRVIATLASVPRRQPGRRGTFAVDLEPGRYGIICFVQDADGVQHAQKGMSSEFRLR
ncbi:MAG TPA: hypothetical protein VM142_11890 [Acidimicrobiales bacterium]|nr:hypothetical protein [Acidimicrobiales bacterium]